MRRLLLHSCCGPCSTAVIERLYADYDITIFYYNPNIHPKSEYDKRKAEQKRYIEIFNKKHSDRPIHFLDCDYLCEEYFDAVKGLEAEAEGGARCAVCFELRLERTAAEAKKGGYDIFATTLSVSPHKSTEKINQIGKAIEEKMQIEFLPENFKKRDGYKRSIELSKQNNLYRQNYCGCIFAKRQQEQK